MNNSSYTGNGSTFISKNTKTKDSKLHFKGYVDLGYGYRSDKTWENDVVASENDTYIFGPNSSLNEIHGNASFANGKCNVYGWLKIYGDYNAKNNALDIYAFTGDYNYPDSTIKLEILGKATGSTDVTLVDSRDVELEGTPKVGQNYINALTESDNTFKLANQNAKENGLYFKKLADADTANKAGYDMWQVAKKDTYRVTYDFESATRGKGLPDAVVDLLPIDAKEYFDGDTVIAIQPDQNEVKVADGVWTFEGYDADSKIASAANVNNDGYINFTGSWKFKKNAGIINQAPEIIAEDKEIIVGDEFNPLDGVTANDPEDGNITLKDENVIKNEVDNNKPGVYEVTYKVTDSKGASFEKTIKVTVKAKDVPVDPGKPDKPIKPDDSDKPGDLTDSSVNGTPNTGDNENMALWAMLLITSCAGLIFVYRKKRKTN